ncbi:MAG: ester cyclase [Gammaproteobacteria bacterium]|nr:ester cyclase [Gammaproteobacteria bacterium]
MENKKIIMNFMQALWVNHELDAIDEVFYSDAIIHSPFNRKKGSVTMKEIAEKWLHTFPDIEFTVHDFVAEDNKVVVRWDAMGTHMGSFFETSPTHKEIRFSGVTAYKLEEGRVREYWALVDMHAILSQLGQYDRISDVVE